LKGTVNEKFTQFKTKGAWEENTGFQGRVDMKNRSAMRRKRYHREKNRKDLSSEDHTDGGRTNKSRLLRQSTIATQGNFLLSNKPVSFYQPNKQTDFSCNKHSDFVTNKIENLRKAEPKDVTEKFGTKIRKTESSQKRKTNTYHPCYITANVEQIMSFLSLIEVIKTKRVSKIWQVAANGTLKRRTKDNLSTAPLLNANAGTLLFSKINALLPRVQSLTINCSHIRYLKSIFLPSLLKCQNLVFLRLENLAWPDFIIATEEIISQRTSVNHGRFSPHMLQDLQLPDSIIPITTGTQCMRLLPKLFSNLRSLTLRSALDITIFSLRLFFPRVRNVFVLDTLWTTRKFAQIISSTPQLMKFLRKRPEVSMVTPKLAEASGIHISSSRLKKREFKLIPRIPRIHKSGCVPVIPSDSRLAAFVCNSKHLLHVEALGRIRMIELGKDLTKGNIRRFAAFCAFIGALIIRPPYDEVF